MSKIETPFTKIIDEVVKSTSFVKPSGIGTTGKLYIDNSGELIYRKPNGLTSQVLSPYFSPSNKIYLDSTAPSGGDGSGSAPFSNIDQLMAWIAGTPPAGLYILKVAPGDYTSTSTFYWPTDPSVLALVCDGDSQVVCNFNSTIVVQGGAQCFFIANDVSFTDITIDMTGSTFHVVNLVRCGFGNSGPPGLVVTPSTAVFSVFFCINCGLNTATFNGNTCNFSDCSTGTIAVNSGATLNMDGGIFLLGAITVAAGGKLKTTGIIELSTATGGLPVNGTHATAVWHTDGTSDFGNTGTLKKISPSMFVTGEIIGATGVASVLPFSVTAGTESSGFYGLGFAPAISGIYQVVLLVQSNASPSTALPVGSIQVESSGAKGVAHSFSGNTLAHHVHIGQFDENIEIQCILSAPSAVNIRVFISRLA